MEIAPGPPHLGHFDWDNDDKSMDLGLPNFSDQ